jgi:hypothetical protein
MQFLKKGLFTLFALLWYCSSQIDKPANKVESTINFKINYNVLNKDGKDEKEILLLWKNFLNNSDFFNEHNKECQSYWTIPTDFSAPNRFLRFLDDIKTYAAKSQVTVIGLYQLKKDTFVVKTMFNFNSDKEKMIMLDNIITIFAVRTYQGFKFMTMPEWYSYKWQKQQVGNIKYYHNESHTFDNRLAVRLDSFNTYLSQKFKIPVVKFTYFVGENTAESYQIMGYDFTPQQFTSNQYGAVADPVNKVIFAGNGTEYYPHEVVHLYTNQFWGKDNLYYHSWFDEGIATLFGGSRGYALEWHLEKLKKYLQDNPQERLNDISTLGTVPNGEFMTEYNYAIGGLLCKKVYEAKGMDGLFALLKSGYTDEDFYQTVEQFLGVKKENFGTFIRSELNKM